MSVRQVGCAMEPTNERTFRTPLRGVAVLHDPRLNKGTAFTDAERDALGLRGLLPPRILTIEEQLERVRRNVRLKPTDLDRYIFLVGLQDRNETLFYRLITDSIVEMMPLIYTPTVGEACRRFGHIFRRPRGLYITARDRGRIRRVLDNWPDRDIAVIVATDGERILGLGDLGAYGMGIPIGKLALYTACAGIDPARCLPVVLDVGTDNDELLHDPLYTGLTQRRLRGEPYDALIDEFVQAVQDAFPRALLQWEDFATDNAVGLLAHYRDRICTFNDDIQGTAAVTVAALMGATRISGVPLREQVVLFYGAGASATGVADLIVAALIRAGVPAAEAMRHCWLFDRHGLVTRERTDLSAHKRPYAHEHPPAADVVDAIERLRPTVLIGLSTRAQSFTEPVIRAMAAHHARPVIFALSNPTANAECTAEQAYRFSDGRAVFASGSPFDGVEVDGRRIVPRQANNAYVFPGVGLGVVVSGARHVTNTMFLAAADALAASVSDIDLARGSVLPPLEQIRDASARVATEVARIAMIEGLATVELPDDPVSAVTAAMYVPEYRSYD
jgi:malate dehydrogenase (oxaloacetate-decarboxylating)(NADP+)